VDLLIITEVIVYLVILLVPAVAQEGLVQQVATMDQLVDREAVVAEI
jgi:hypothetical protein